MMKSILNRITGVERMFAIGAIAGITGAISNIVLYQGLGAKSMESATEIMNSGFDKALIYVATVFTGLSMALSALVIVAAFFTMVFNVGNKNPMNPAKYKLIGITLVAVAPAAYFSKDIGIISTIHTVLLLVVGYVMATGASLHKLSVKHDDTGIKASISKSES